MTTGDPWHRWRLAFRSSVIFGKAWYLPLMDILWYLVIWFNFDEKTLILLFVLEDVHVKHHHFQYAVLKKRFNSLIITPHRACTCLASWSAQSAQAFSQISMIVTNNVSSSLHWPQFFIFHYCHSIYIYLAWDYCHFLHSLWSLPSSGLVERRSAWRLVWESPSLGRSPPFPRPCRSLTWWWWPVS